MLSIIGLIACDNPVSTEIDKPILPLFKEVAKQVGLDFIHFNGMIGKLYFVEMMGGGAALFDYDNDGDLDLYLTQGDVLGEDKLEQAIFQPQSPLSDRLYQNQLIETGQLGFKDITDSSGIRANGYGMGVAIGDMNNDGWLDIYVTNFGSNQLWQNQGNGQFIEVTAKLGVDDNRWSSSVMFVDYDQDGWLDLYVSNYVDYRLVNHKSCSSSSGIDEYCGPNSYNPEPDRLWRNLGNGKFKDVSINTGIALQAGAGLGVVAADFDQDGLLDFYIANDGMENYFWVNQGDGRFENQALLAGVAFNRDGMPEASMGVDAVDFDNDGDLDLFITHLKQETNTLYINQGQGLFDDQTNTKGLGGASRSYTGFGTAWIDYNLDGLMDLFIANGEVRAIEELLRQHDPFPIHQSNQLFQQLNNGQFQETTQQAGKALKLSEVSRGVAFGDLDNDGDHDLVVVNNAGPVRLLLNQNETINPKTDWLGLKLINKSGHADGVNIEVLQSAKPSIWYRSRRVASYLSSNDPRVLIGLGKNHSVTAIKLYWSDGSIEVCDVNRLVFNSYQSIKQGQCGAS